MAQIGFIGTGEIATALVCTLAGRGHAILVSQRNAEVSKALADQFEEVTVADNQSVLDRSDIVFLCLLKGTAETVLPELSFDERHSVISAMADVQHSELQAWCAPAAEICMTIPLPSIVVGGCPLPVFPASPALDYLFGSENLILPQASEQALNAHFAACATASAIFTQLDSTAEWLARLTGDRTAAETYLIAEFAGMLNSMVLRKPDQFKRTLQSLSTEGGLNASLRELVEDAGVPELIEFGLDGLRERLNLPPAQGKF